MTQAVFYSSEPEIIFKISHELTLFLNQICIVFPHRPIFLSSMSEFPFIYFMMFYHDGLRIVTAEIARTAQTSGNPPDHSSFWLNSADQLPSGLLHYSLFKCSE